MKSPSVYLKAKLSKYPNLNKAECLYCLVDIHMSDGDVMLYQSGYILTLKAPIMTAADDTHNYFFIVFIENKT